MIDSKCTPGTSKNVLKHTKSPRSQPVSACGKAEAQCAVLNRHSLCLSRTREVNTKIGAGPNNRGRLKQVLGNWEESEEGGGLDPHIAQRCSRTLTIPLGKGVESLNVGAAAAVMIHALVGDPSASG